MTIRHVFSLILHLDFAALETCSHRVKLFYFFFAFKQLEKKSVLDTEVEAKAFLEVMGKKIHSEGYREPADID